MQTKVAKANATPSSPSRALTSASDHGAQPLRSASLGTTGAGGMRALMKRLRSRGSAEAQRALMQLQRQYGNRHVQRMLAAARQGDEEDELRAQREDEEEELPLQRKGAGEEDEVAPEVEATINRKRGGGQALDSGTRIQMGAAFGADFGGVRVHADTEADTLNRALGARAFTTGRDVFFRQGEYSPSTTSGQELLAHELTHVVQQNGGEIRGKLTVSQPGDPLEREADEAANALIHRMQHWAAAQHAEDGRPIGTVKRQETSREQEGEEDHQAVEIQAKRMQGADEPTRVPQNGGVQCTVVGQPQDRDIVQRQAAAAVMGAAEWIALGSAGYNIAQDAVQSTAGDVSYTFDEMEGVLLPGGGNDVSTYHTRHPDADIKHYTHTVSTWLPHWTGGRAMGIKFGISFNYDGHAIGNISCNILDTYDWPAWAGTVNVNFTPQSLARGDLTVVRITLNLNSDRTLLGGMVRSRILELEGSGTIRKTGSGAHVRFGE